MTAIESALRIVDRILFVFSAQPNSGIIYQSKQKRIDNNKDINSDK